MRDSKQTGQVPWPAFYSTLWDIPPQWPHGGQQAWKAIKSASVEMSFPSALQLHCSGPRFGFARWKPLLQNCCYQMLNSNTHATSSTCVIAGFCFVFCFFHFWEWDSILRFLLQTKRLNGTLITDYCVSLNARHIVVVCFPCNVWKLSSVSVGVWKMDKCSRQHTRLNPEVIGRIYPVSSQPYLPYLPWGLGLGVYPTWSIWHWWDFLKDFWTVICVYFVKLCVRMFLPNKKMLNIQNIFWCLSNVWYNTVKKNQIKQREGSILSQQIKKKSK